MKQAIRQEALAAGFDAVGFCAADATTLAGQRLKEFVAAGLYGDMDWMAERVEQRSLPTRLWDEAKSAVVLGFNYGPGINPLTLLDHPDRGNISVYARGKDYHDLVKKRLKRVARMIHQQGGAGVKVFVDTAPVMEKPLSQAGGIGWQGKHTNLVSRDFGSWMFLGVILTTLDLEPDGAEADHCGQCRRCLDSCPTEAFMGPYRLDARRCISYLTIEYKGHIPLEFRKAMGNRVYGCDDCLAVCPWNKFAQVTTVSQLQPHVQNTAPRLKDYLSLDDAAFRDVFRGSPVKRTGRDRFLRNVLIAVGNSELVELIQPTVALLRDDSPLVRAMAVWALTQLDPAEAQRQKARLAPTEPDPAVLSEWAAVL